MVNWLFPQINSPPSKRIILTHPVDSYMAMHLALANEMWAEMTCHLRAESLRASAYSALLFPAMTVTSNVPDHPGYQSEHCMLYGHWSRATANSQWPCSMNKEWTSFVRDLGVICYCSKTSAILTMPWHTQWDHLISRKALIKWRLQC